MSQQLLTGKHPALHRLAKRLRPLTDMPAARLHSYACSVPSQRTWATIPPRTVSHPLARNMRCREGGVPSTSGQPETPQLPPDVGLVFSAQAQGAVYIVGRSTVVARAGSPRLRRWGVMSVRIRESRGSWRVCVPVCSNPGLACRRPWQCTVAVLRLSG